MQNLNKKIILISSFIVVFLFFTQTSFAVSLPYVPDLPHVELPTAPVLPQVDDLPEVGPIPWYELEEAPQLPEVPPLPWFELPFVPSIIELMSKIWEEFAILMAFINELASALFSWDSSAWENMQQVASDYWKSRSDNTDGALEYFYDAMAGLADFGSRLNLGLLAFSIIPFAGITELFALGKTGASVTLEAVEVGLSKIPVELLKTGPSGVAGVGNGVNYVQAGSVGIREALMNNPISTVLIKHEAAHILGASEVTAWQITSQAFSQLTMVEKIQTFKTLPGINTAIAWGLEHTLPTLNKTFMQLGYLPNALKGLTWNIWKGY